ncbi:hypothetical protein M422DRAFT_226138 [Sphaerobolus stellatus SS14]|uniref:AB hydrolase-1 domain-containing protein n=1 Tax=Sphaerobolus stellatus (strain SS14) TaxID=990650 RepID=A0A0C9VVR7_SPHS4|nr:hypothetical protein M422DRAFT_226138 [Sphaerobolus stellatus SS14]
MTSVVQCNTVDVDGVDVFYRSAGAPTAAMTILLLHGFPTSSYQFRNLIPLLAPKYRVIAPDLPGFGFTNVPQALNYNYTFDNLANTIQAFVNALGLKQFAVYVFDYGAPVGFRLATSKPDQISAIISQNGNAYAEGLTSFWDPFKAYWNSSSVFDPTVSSPEAQNMLQFLSEGSTQWQYTTGVPKAKLPGIDPAAYTLDSSLLQRVDQNITQLSLFFDYQTNMALYPVWHEYLRTKNPRVLALWAKNDPIFGPAGAEGFKKDLKDVEVGFVDTGHFALETDVEVYAARIDTFLQSVVKSGKHYPNV